MKRGDDKMQGQKAYGKRSLWQWIIVYLIVGAVIYGLVYLFMTSRGGGY